MTRLQESRVCVACDKKKPLTVKFYGLDRGRFQRRCRICHAAAQRKRWRENPNAKELDSTCRRRHRDEIRVYDQMRSKRDRVKKRAWQKQWRSNNPGRHRQKSIEYNAKRRARSKGAGGSFSADDLARLISAQKNKCWWCGKKMRAPEIDHRVPLARGGTNDRSNIVVACRPCNRSKWTSMPWEFCGRLL